MPNIGILIPALNPDGKLLQLLKDILAAGSFPAEQIVLVDDGTDVTHQAIFEEATLLNAAIVVLHHPENLGKGAALKTGFQYFIDHLPAVTGIATLDSDGQHTVTDLQKCVALFAQQPAALVIGARTFSQDIPLRSRFGNVLTNRLVRGLTGLKITDTQTGLRVIPITYARQLVNFSGDRFQFEFDMLLRAKEFHVAIVEQPIATIYLDDNASSHFRVIRDSISIYARFLKFAASGIISFLIDIILFTLIVKLTGNFALNGIMFATILARILSAIANYVINHKVVFGNAGRQTLVKYVALMLCQMVASGLMTRLIAVILPVLHSQTATSSIAKMIGDTLLFFVSYQIQKRVIFTDHTVHHAA